jgi:Uncharacterised nucleotidyltransferase/Transglutaminase-like superfamily
MAISSALHTLILACRLYFKTATDDEWQQTANDRNINWNEVYNLAAWHQVRPLLFEALRQYKPSDLPVNYFERLRNFCRQLAIENLSRVRQTQDLVIKLEAANIKTVLHKGVHYASLYQNVAHREFGDIDLLIDPADIKKATTLMQEWGYRLDLDYVEGADVVDLDYHSTFFPAIETGLSPVEIHWKPHIRTQIETKDLIINRDSSAIYNADLPTPAMPSVFLLMATHHGTKEHWHKLKYLCDLGSLLLTKNQEIDWTLAQKNNLNQPLKVGVDLVNNILEFNKISTNQYKSALQNQLKGDTVGNWLQQANEISTDDNVTQNAQKSNETAIQKTNRLIKKFQVLSLTMQSYLWRAAVVVLVVKVGLKIMPYSVFKKYYDKLPESTMQKTYSDQDLKKAAWAIQVVSARWPWRATCLPQALTFKYLHRNDPQLQLQIGVNKGTLGQLQAHAWVEKEGQILIGDSPETFKPIWTW